MNWVAAVRRAVVLPLLGVACVAQAGEIGEGGPDLEGAMQCFDEEVAPVIGPATVDLILFGLGMGSKPEDFSQVVTELGDACTERHGVQHKSQYLFGRYVGAVSVRAESRKRLEALGYDFQAVDAALAAHGIDYDTPMKEQTRVVWDKLAADGQLGFDPTTPDSLMLVALVGSYISSSISLPIETYKLENDQ
jgi:hypothetical protein